MIFKNEIEGMEDFNFDRFTKESYHWCSWYFINNSDFLFGAKGNKNFFFYYKS